MILTWLQTVDEQEQPNTHIIKFFGSSFIQDILSNIKHE